MINVIKTWFNRYFSDPEAVLLIALLALGFGLIFFMGNILAPILISIVIAYLLEWLVKYLQRKHIRRMPAVTIVYAGFLSLFFVLFFILIPMVWRQITVLFVELPSMVSKAQVPLNELVQKYPDYFSEQQIQALIATVTQDAKTWGTTLLSVSIASIPGLLTWLVYLVLIPFLVLFFLKDQQLIKNWFLGFLPAKRVFVSQVAKEVNEQIGNYFRGKMIEIFFSWILSSFIFAAFGLKSPVVLGLILGISTLIPYVGVVIALIPIAVVAFLQWGWGIQLGYIIGIYFAIQAALGYIAEPLLFSEALNLHPVAIITAVLVFGGLWGFWGIFFAIPLATLVKAVLNAWPRRSKVSTQKR